MADEAKNRKKNVDDETRTHDQVGKPTTAKKRMVTTTRLELARKLIHHDLNVTP